MTVLRRLRAAAAAFASPQRTYGGAGTIHQTGEVDVELSPTGQVVAVWFRCVALPFTQRSVDVRRAVEMVQMYEHLKPESIEAVVFSGRAA